MRNFVVKNRQMQAVLAEEITSKPSRLSLNYTDGKYKLLEQFQNYYTKATKKTNQQEKS
jgi:hypothetical protein